MRVLTIVSDLGSGGTQRTAQNLTAGYAAAGHPVAVYAYVEGGRREAEIQAIGAEMFIGPPGGQALDQAVAWRPDLIHIHRHGTPDATSAAILRRFDQACPEARVVETNHFARVDRSPDRHLIDVHLQLSEWCLWKWSQWRRGLHPAPVGAVVPNPVDLDAFHPVSDADAQAFRDTLGLEPDDVLLGRIGQPIEWKWLPLVVESFARLAREDPRLHLLLVGRPDSLDDAVNALEPDVRRRLHEITFLHGDAALRAAYTAIDVFSHAAEIGESFGLVLTESMLCETPVVTLSRPLRDNSQLGVVEHEVGGLVAATPEAFDAATRRLVADPALRATLGRQGRERTRERFGLDTVMQTVLRIVGHVQATDSPDALRQALAADPNIVTDVPERRIKQLLSHMEGETPLHIRALMRLLHQPAVYALWRRLKGS